MVVFEMSSVLVMFPMTDSPRVIGDQKDGVKDESNGVIDPLVVRE